MKELYKFRQFLTEDVIKEEQISPDPLYDMGYSAGEKAVMALSTELFNQPYFDQYADGFIKGFQDNVRASQDYAANSVAEGVIKEESIPSGWKKIDTSNDYEEEERQGRLMGFEAPMSGIEGDEVDNIYIEQDGDEYEVHVMTAFNNPEYEGPFSSKEEALKVAIQKMEDLKKDWDE